MTTPADPATAGHGVGGHGVGGHGVGGHGVGEHGADGAPRLRRVLVANRGEIAVRIVRACRDEEIESVAMVSGPDRGSLAALLADRVVEHGPGLRTNPYLSVPSVIAAALLTGCDAVHPGYGFLSERADLAESCADHGLTFVGPAAGAIRRGGDKVAARALAAELGVPISRGSDAIEDPAVAARVASAAGYPVLLKAAAGGGGRGMTLVERPEDLAAAFSLAAHEAHQAFGDGRLYVERFVSDARHVEVQVLGDRFGQVVHLGDRDCSYQRRYQKLLEESPASGVADHLRAELAEAAVALVGALDYVGAATVEFLVDQERQEFVFLEVNTRVQVEHPVTEAVTGIDIVREQLRLAAGAPLSFRQSDVTLVGHAIECRINAEDPRRGFTPSPGRIEEFVVPEGDHVRVDSHCFPGYVVPPQYDSLLAKIIVRGPDRAGAVRRLDAVLRRTRITGPRTTLELHRATAGHPDFHAARVNTTWLERVFLPGWEPGPDHAPARDGGASEGHD